MNSRMSMKRAAFLTLLGTLTTNAHLSYASDWVGATAAWNDANNWNPAGIPSIATPVVFGGTGSTTVNLNGLSQDLQDITFSSGALGFSFSGNAGDALNFSSIGFINVSSGVTSAQTISAPLTLNGGPFTITNTDSTNGSLVLGGGISLLSGVAGTLIVGGDGNTNINGTIAAGAVDGFTKNGNGTLTLGAVNAYTGTNTILGGTVATTADGALGVNSALNFGDQGATAFGTLNVNSNESVGGLTVQSNSASVNTINIGSGKTLTVNGDFRVGFVNSSANSAVVTNLTINGAGALAINGTTFSIGRHVGSVNVVDMTALGSFTATVTNFDVANSFGTSGSTSGSSVASTLLLSNTSNIITATTMTIGNDGSRVGTPPELMQLGTGTNIINADTIIIGRGRSNMDGKITFASQTPNSPGTLTIAGAAGGSSTSEITVGYFTGTGSGDSLGVQGTLDLRGHNATIAAGTLIVGRSDTANNVNGTGNTTGIVHFDGGTFTANTVIMARKTGNLGAAAAPTVGIINITKGNFTVNPGGSFTMASKANNNGSADATLNITGGVLTSNADILTGAVSGSGSGGATSTINLDGGTLDMTGHTLGNATAITNLNLMSGTLSNVGQINNGLSGLTKSSAGTLVLSGTNTYTGNTTVSAGTLNITGNHTTGANYSVASSANLITNNVRVTNALTVDGNATINANGGATGASKAETLAINTGGKLNLKDNDLVVGTGTVASVHNAIKLGLTGTAGITSDLPAFGVTTGFGYALGSDAAISPLLAGSLTGQSYDADSVLVKYTFLGDADLDGDSDLNDLGLWAQSFTGDLGNPVTPVTFWTSGDFDYDGDTDLNDLGFWAGTFTGDLGGGAGSLIVVAPNAPAGAVAALNSMGITVVPEPSTFVLAGVGLAGLAIAARRKRSA